MSRRNLENVASSVHDRLLDRARSEDRRFDDLLQYYAMERFLYRLSRSAHANSFTLKGALLLRTHAVSEARLTRDIDLLGTGSNNVDHLVDVVKDCSETRVVDDGIRFDPDSVSGTVITEGAVSNGVRITFLGFLGRARIRMQLDVGFGDEVTPGPVLIEYPAMLEFDSPILKGYPLETVIAEKYQAMVYLGMINSRLKDFYDVWFISERFDIDGSSLAEAIRKTFARRGTELQADLPVFMTATFSKNPEKISQWSSFTKSIGKISDQPSLQSVVDRVADFLLPPTRHILNNIDFGRRWRPGHGWNESGRG